MSIYLSASSIKDFIRCSKRAYYRFSKEVEEIPSVEMTIGKVVHSAIEKHWDDLPEAHIYVDEQAKKYRLSSAEIMSSKKYLMSFFDNFDTLVGENDLIEYHFKLLLYDDVYLVGKMDRISDGNIYDWKTGTIKSKRLFNDPQCIIYNYAYEKIFKKAPRGVYLAALQTGELIPYNESHMHTEELFETIIPNMVRTVRNGTYEKLGLFNGACYRCPYRVGCLKLGDTDVVDSSINPE